jgi:hypothetical protein
MTEIDPTFAALHDKHCHADVVVVGPTIAFIDAWDMDNQELICSNKMDTIVWDMTELPSASFYSLEAG